MSDALQEAVQRILEGKQDEADLRMIANAIQSKRIILVSSNGPIEVGGDVENSAIVPGNYNIIGNNNIVIQGQAANTIQDLLKQEGITLSKFSDELSGEKEDYPSDKENKSDTFDQIWQNEEDSYQIVEKSSLSTPKKLFRWEVLSLLSVVFLLFCGDQTVRIIEDLTRSNQGKNLHSSDPSNINKPTSYAKTFPNINYSDLEKFLKNSMWKAADLETEKILLSIVDEEEKKGDLDLESLKRKLPCKELSKINSFWIKYSNSRFGFSVQTRIYSNISQQLEEKNPAGEIWYDFSRRVGWRTDDEWLPYEKLNFSNNAPTGHFPYRFFRGEKLSWPSPFIMNTIFSLKCYPDKGSALP